MTENIGSSGDQAGKRRFGNLSKLYERLLKIRGNPREIALGFALGIFIGMSPTIGFQMIIAVPLASLMKWNKIASALGVWISNPFTAPFLYGLTYFVGAKIMGVSGNLDVGKMILLLSRVPSLVWDAMMGHPGNGLDLGVALSEIFSRTSIFLKAAALGGVVLGLPLSIAAFYVVHSAIVKYREEIKQRITKQKEELKLKLARQKEKRVLKKNERSLKRRQKKRRIMK